MQFIRRAFLQSITRPKIISYPFSSLNLRGKFFLKKYKCHSGAFVISFAWFSQARKEENESEKLKLQLLTLVDNLYKQNKFREVYDLLVEHKNCDDVEILWRLSRVQYNISQEFATNPEERKVLIFEAYKIISKSLALDENHFANHKWMSILLDARSIYYGIKARISNLEVVKEHLLKAAELNPKDATTLYMLGYWCYEITNMPWYQRKIASMIFTTPPTSTFEEALEYFNKAEEVEPRFYSHNLLMLGKTYLKLNKEDQARYYLDLACNYPISTDDDILANKEACDLLMKLTPKKISI
ncbi:regulator of microtubule dynamics protein 1-like isoform X1 [Rhodnius prolixus]|uniref:Regulator of microtubule dynamics protein 1 n=3 Tax=Rhodnius TaxID=13248 RepID=A0A4P6D7T0_RHOPR